LEILNNLDVKYNITFTVAGPIEDNEYWQNCIEAIKKLSKNIQFDYIGNIPNAKIIDIISINHVLVNPSHGENFGYSIVESLQSYRPVLISDNTPWCDLEKFNAGWNFSLTRPDLFEKALIMALNWDQEKFNLHCLGAKSYIELNMNISEITKEYTDLFLE
jgi:glycosyltransferase involved in cell wall biosynthesis